MFRTLAASRRKKTTPTYLSHDGSTVFMRRTISEWEELLPKPPFFTPHRSLIVNLQAVGDLVLQSRAEVSFKLEGRPHSFKLGQRPAARLRKALRLSRGL